jgi:hypothetical protein
MAPTPAQAVLTEMMEFEMRCNSRCTPLNSYLVLYTEKNAKDNDIVRKTTMVCPTITHVVIRFPSAVKIELLSDAYVAIAPVITPKLGEETDPEDIPQPEIPAPAPQDPPRPPAPAPMVVPRRVPLIAGFGLCRVCKHSPFAKTNIAGRCLNHGHRFDKDPADKRCEGFEFP